MSLPCLTLANVCLRHKALITDVAGLPYALGRCYQSCWHALCRKIYIQGEGALTLVQSINFKLSCWKRKKKKLCVSKYLIKKAAVSLSPDGALLGGVKMWCGMTGKLGHAWHWFNPT